MGGGFTRGDVAGRHGRGRSCTVKMANFMQGDVTGGTLLSNIAGGDVAL